jgi:hypothetical protein
LGLCDVLELIAQNCLNRKRELNVLNFIATFKILIYTAEKIKLQLAQNQHIHKTHVSGSFYSEYVFVHFILLSTKSYNSSISGLGF